jgi:hypothetical protein
MADFSALMKKELITFILFYFLFSNSYYIFNSQGRRRIFTPRETVSVHFFQGI